MNNNCISCNALQKFYSALKNLNNFSINNDIIDNISALDCFFSEFRNITFVLQKVFSDCNLTEKYEALRKKYLINDDMKWFINKRNEITKQAPLNLEKNITIEIYLPKNCYTWCNYQVMHLKEAPAYTYADFWSKKPKFFRPFYKALSYLIAPLCVFIFNNAKTIPVYHDAKVIHTFKDSVKLLQDGNHIVIFLLVRIRRNIYTFCYQTITNQIRNNRTDRKNTCNCSKYLSIKHHNSIFLFIRNQWNQCTYNNAGKGRTNASICR